MLNTRKILNILNAIFNLSKQWTQVMKNNDITIRLHVTQDSVT